MLRADGALLSVGEIISLQHARAHYLHINYTLAEAIFFLIEVFQIIRLLYVSDCRQMFVHLPDFRAVFK